MSIKIALTSIFLGATGSAGVVLGSKGTLFSNKKCWYDLDKSFKEELKAIIKGNWENFERKSLNEEEIKKLENLFDEYCSHDIDYLLKETKKIIGERDQLFWLINEKLSQKWR